MTATELAAILLTYGDMPVAVQAVTTEGGLEVGVVEAAQDMRCEIITDKLGFRSVAVTAFTPEDS